MSDLFDDTQLQAEVPQDLVISEEGPFVIIPVALISEFGERLGAYGIAVYVGLKSHANRQQGMTTFILTETLAKELKIGESTVRRELTRLADLGLITKTRRFGRSSVYGVKMIRYDIAEHALPRSGTSATIERYNHKNLTNNTTATSLPAVEGVKSKPKRRSREEIISEYQPETKKLVNSILEIWPTHRPGNHSKINPSLPVLASRIELVLQTPGVDPQIVIGSVKRYLSENRNFPHSPEFFFGPGKDGEAPWKAFARMEYHERNKPVKVLATGSVN